MIRILVREQLRSQARYAAAAFALVAMATSLAAFLLVSFATVQRETARVTTLTSGDTQNHATVTVWTDGEPMPRPQGAPAATHAAAGLESLIAALTAQGSPPHVRLDAFVWIAGDPVAHQFGAVDVVPANALAAGTAPGPGQIVVDTALARAQGLSVGDTVTLGPESGAAPTVSLEVSGILRGARSSVGPTPPRMLVTIAEGWRLIEEAGYLAVTDSAGERSAFMTVEVSWNGAVPKSIAAYTYQSGPSTPSAAGPHDGLAILALGLAVVTSLVAAAAAGVSQGAARTRWVGTLRALGATRRDVMRAALIEIVAVGMVAGALGVAAGVAVNVVAIRRAGGTFAGDWPSLPLWAIALPFAMALAVSLVLGAAPAYWAARSTPAAALRPVGPADGPPPAPRFVTKKLAAVWTVVAVLVVVRAGLRGTGRGWSAAVFVVEVTAVAVGLFVLGTGVMMRVVTLIGTALGARQNALAVASGIGLTQQPRRAASVASSLAAGGIAAGAAVWMWAARPGSTTSRPGARPWNEAIEAAGVATLITTLGIGAAATMVGLALWIARGAIARDASIMGALGMGRRDRQLSALMQVGISGFAGSALGLLCGTAGAALTTTILAWCGRATSPQSPAGVTSAAQGAVVWLGALLGLALVSAAVALVAARASDGKDPAALKRKANRAGVPG